MDTKNPDLALRSRSLKHIVFIAGVRWADGERAGGSIYDVGTAWLATTVLRY
jgi:hypothetical protein